MGPIAVRMHGADVAMLVGLPVSAITYLVACRSLDLETELRQVANADRDLEPPAAIHPNPSDSRGAEFRLSQRSAS
jgi:polysaccharide pyruvyl transferase WcaK-like protein